MTQLAFFGASPVEWAAYVAGLLDGEGNIDVRRQNYRERPHAQFGYQPRVRIAMCDVAPLHELHATYGGGLRKRFQLNPAWRDSYEWCVWGGGCIRPLQDALPFLRVKREQALLVLDVAFGITRGGGASISFPEYERRRRAYCRIKELNARGPRT